MAAAAVLATLAVDREVAECDDDDEAPLECVAESAEAAPHPYITAAPIPSAAANPPIRPTYAAGPMAQTPIVTASGPTR